MNNAAVETIGWLNGKFLHQIVWIYVQGIKISKWSLSRTVLFFSLCIVAFVIPGGNLLKNIQTLHVALSNPRS